MGYIGHQLGLHSLALYFFLNRLLKTFLDSGKLLVKWSEYPQILLDLHIQISVSHLIDGQKEDLILLPRFFPIAAQNHEQDNRIYNQCKNSKKPEAADQHQD